LWGKNAAAAAFCLAFVVLASAAINGWMPSSAYSQDPDNPAPAPATPDPAPAPAAAPSGAAPSTGDQSLLAFYYNALGIWYTLSFLTMSFVGVALVVMNILATQRNAVIPPALIAQFEARLNEKQYQEAYEMARTDESYLGQVLAAGMTKLSAGYDKAVLAMQEVADEENMKLEHRISYIALIGSLAPMVGLYGTVDGMIAAFRVIANSTAQPKPSELAFGISTALVTTIVGLFIAIPMVIAYAYLRNTIAKISLDIGIITGSLMGRFETADPKGK